MSDLAKERMALPKFLEMFFVSFLFEALDCPRNSSYMASSIASYLHWMSCSSWRLAYFLTTKLDYDE